METIGTYLLRSSVWLAGFGLVYVLFLRNERFFLLNRVYLVGGMILSLIFPLFTWHYTVVIPVIPAAVEVLNPMPAMVPVSPERSFSLYDVLWMSYSAGFLLLILRTLTQLFTVGKVVSQSEIRSFETVKVVHTDRYPTSFSFFNFVFVNPSIAENEMREIIHHEREHIGQRHWIDLMLFELVCLVQWFNPMVWLYGRLIRQNHEYLADERALQRSQNPAVYRAALLNQMFGGPVIPLTNSFNYSLNKKRFYMMKKTISSPIRKLRLLVVLPLIASVFYAFAAPEYQFVEQKKEPLQLNAQLKIESIIQKGIVVDEAGKSLPSATVIEVDNAGRNTSGTITDQSGNFVLKVKEGATLNVVLSGYEPQKVTAQSGNEMRIVLKKASNSSAAPKTSSVAPPPPPKLVKLAVGKVVDEAGNPLDMAGVRIYDKNGNYAGGMVTDRNGRFGLGIQEGTKLNVALPGYLTQTVITETGKEMLIVLKKAGSPGDQKNIAEPKFAILKGKVVDETGKSLPSATVVEVDNFGRNTSGTITDQSGNFVLKGKETATLNVVLSGYQAQKVTAESGNEMLIVLKKATSSTVDSNTSVQNSSNLKIRATGSLNNAKPLIVIDGKIAENQDANAISPDEIQSITVLKDQSATALWGEKGKDGVIEITMKKATSTGSDEVYFMVDEMPQFPGGESALLQFIARSVKYPAEAQEKGIQGKVAITFVVSKTGDVKDVRVAKGVDPLLDKEALRVVNTLPKWIPGKQNGAPANVAYTIPVSFVLASPAKPVAQETDASVIIRSVDGNKATPSPLIVVDGKPIETGSFDFRNADINDFGKVVGVAPENIQSIEVLKDPSSTALYGEKGKNGVLIINTKAAASKKEEKAIEPVAPMKKLIIVPNPASNQVTITAEDMKSAGKLVVRVFDPFGKELIRENKTGPTFTLSISGLVPGTYMVVANEDAQAYSGNLVVVR